MEKMTGIVGKLSREMDRLAGFCLVGVMLLVVCNILLRRLFKMPISGTYEIVGYLTALSISLSLAYCAVQNAHIGLDYIIEKFPKAFRSLSAILNNLIAASFWALTAWQIGCYAMSLIKSGDVSPTAEIPVYPVVFLIGLGFVALSLVSAVKFLQCARAVLVLRDKPADRFAAQSSLIARAEEGN